MPLGQLPFFIEYLRLRGLFGPLVADCPLVMTSPNAPAKRDVLGTLLLSALSGHKRYAHITGLRGDGVNPDLLGMKKVVNEDAVRRFFRKIEDMAGAGWLRGHLDYATRPLLCESWILDTDSPRSNRSTASRTGRLSATTRTSPGGRRTPTIPT